MATAPTLEILDLRHFDAPLLRPVLEAEAAVWRERLQWDYLVSARLLLQYLDARTLPGYVATDQGRVTGYAFCVYEDTKAVIGDVFALPHGLNGQHATAMEVEVNLLGHTIELLTNSPGLTRIESQLLLHPDGILGDVFRSWGFEVFRRLYLRRWLAGPPLREPADLEGNLELRTWHETDLGGASRLIATAYHGHPDALINDQYRSVAGSQRFLQNIVRYPGCGEFSKQASQVVIDRRTRETVGLILGSRVSSLCGHITQVCVHPDYRRKGIARALLQKAALEFQRVGATMVTLTVTEANRTAVDLYTQENYEETHRFCAAVWNREDQDE